MESSQIVIVCLSFMVRKRLWLNVSIKYGSKGGDPCYVQVLVSGLPHRGYNENGGYNNPPGTGCRSVATAPTTPASTPIPAPPSTPATTVPLPAPTDYVPGRK